MELCQAAFEDHRVNKMADTMKWRVFMVCVLALVLKVEKVTSSQEILKKMTIGFSKVLEQCKNEVRIILRPVSVTIHIK